MCKLVTVVKENNDNVKKIENILRAQESKLMGEKDGISAITVDGDGKVRRRRSLKDYRGIIDWACAHIDKSKLISIHTRTATTGSVTKNNTHFYEDGGYFLAHNGFVSEYATSYYSGYGKYAGRNKKARYNKSQNHLGKKKNKNEDEDEEIEELVNDYLNDEEELDDDEKKIVEAHLQEELKEAKQVGKETRQLLQEGDEEEEKSDTYKFLKNLPKPINENVIYEEMEDKKFSGVATLYDENSGLLYTFSTREIETHTNFDDFIVYYSYKPESSIPQTKRYKGLDVIVDGKLRVEEKSIPEGIYCTQI